MFDTQLVPRPPDAKSDGDGSFTQIRRFTDDKLQATIDSVLADLPSYRHVVVIGVADLKGASGIVAVRVGSHFDIAGLIHKDYTGPFDAMVVGRATF